MKNKHSRSLLPFTDLSNINLLIYLVFFLCFIEGIFISKFSPVASLGLLSLIFLVYLMPVFLEKEHLPLLLLIALIPFIYLLPFLEEQLSMLPIFGFFVFGICLMNLFIKKSSMILVPQYKYLIVLALLMLISSILSNDLINNFLEFKSYLMRFLLFFLVIMLIRKPNHLFQTGWVLIVSLSIVAFSVLLDQWKFVDLVGSPLGYGKLHRSVGVIDDANQTAFTLCFGIPFSAYYLLIYKQIKQRLLLIVLFSMLLLATIATYSVGGLVNLLSTLFLMLLFSGHIRDKKVAVLLSLVLISLIILFFSVSSLKGRIQQQYDVIRHEDFAKWGTNRGGAWIASLRVIQNNPLLGVGPGNVLLHLRKHYPLPLSHYKLLHGIAPHNMFLHIACAVGLIGFLFFGILVFITVSNLYSSILALKKQSCKHLVFLGQAIFISIVAHLVHGLAHGAQRDILLWVFFGLAVSFSLISTKSNCGK